MSAERRECVVSCSDTTGQSRFLLYVLGELTNVGLGYAYPSEKTLAGILGTDRRNIARLVKRVVGAGLLWVERGRGAKHPNRYFVFCRKGVHATPFQKQIKASFHAQEKGVIPVLKVGPYRSKGDAAPKAAASSLKTPPLAGAVTTNLLLGGQSLATTSAVASKSIAAEVLGGERSLDARRALARAIREAKDPRHQRRYLHTFEAQYGHLYEKAAA